MRNAAYPQRNVVATIPGFGFRLATYQSRANSAGHSSAASRSGEGKCEVPSTLMAKGHAYGAKP